MNKELIAQLQRLVLRDNDTRDRLLKEGRLYGSYQSDMQRVHNENAQALDGILAVHGWPGVSAVGREGSRNAWLVAQHAIGTPALQRRFLRALKTAADAGDAPQKQVALLTDRIRFNEGRPQVYGTVLDWNRDGDLDCELEDRERVDERRAPVGLPPFRQSLAEQRRAVEIEGGRPPDDYSAYRVAADRWAREIGWR